LQSHEDVNDVLVHIDSEDDEHQMYSCKLPSRRELLACLNECWVDIDAAQQIEAITLHYLHNRIQVVLLLPLSVLDDGLSATELGVAFAAASQDIEVVDNVQLSFH